MRYIALIPAKERSSRLQNKNLQEVGGSSLVERAVTGAVESACFDQVYVSTDSDEIVELASKLGVLVHYRRPELCRDTTVMNDVIVTCIADLNLEDDCVICLLQPTSPGRNSTHIKEAKSKFCNSDCSLLLSATRASEHPYKMLRISGTHQAFSLGEDEFLFENTQNLPAYYRPNGALFLFTVSNFKKQYVFPTSKIHLYLMSKADSVDVDDEIDLKLANLLLSAPGNHDEF